MVFFFEKNLIPAADATSAITGEGVQDILLLVVQITQDLMTSRLMYSAAFECTLLEVKVIPGLGTTIDVVLIQTQPLSFLF